MLQYDWQRVTVAGNPPLTITKLFGSDNRRVALVVSVIVSGGVGTDVLQLYYRPSANNLWLAIPVPGTYTLPYRDYGPIIRDEIYYQSLGGNTDIWVAASFIANLGTP